MSDLQTFTPDSNKYGESLARTNRILSWLLYSWAASPDDRRKVRPQYLESIYFDKLGELTCRILDALQDRGVVRFRSAYRSYRGIHGPGRAIPIDRLQDERESLGKHADDFRRHKFAYTTEVIEKLQPTLGLARKLFSLDGAPPWSYKCRISSQMWPNLWESWLGESGNNGEDTFLTPRELDLVHKLSSIICVLSEEQLRALGTHSNKKQTISAIEFNVDKWEEKINSVISILQIGLAMEKSITPAETALYIAKEIKRKSRTNQYYYKIALKAVNRVLATINDRELWDAVKNTQEQNADAIWDDKVVKVYAAHADKILDLSTYVKSVIHVIVAQEKLTDADRMKAMKAGKMLAGFMPIYGSVFSEFPRDRNSLLVFVDAIRETSEMIKGLLPSRNPRRLGIPPTVSRPALG
jgi:hypothetical protein